MFVFQNANTEGLKLPQVSVVPVEIRGETSKFDLTLFIEERAQGFNASIEYSVSLFDDSTIARMWGHFESLLSEIIKYPSSASRSCVY
jgi:non-ribosomal peptide synthetase component F